METLQLIQGLYHAQATARRQATLVIGMVEETGALGALHQRIREEPDAQVKDIIVWAGKRIETAHRRGFSTIDAMFDHFQINRELASGIDPEEAEFLRHQTIISTPSSNDSGIFSDIKMGSMLTADNIKTGRLGSRKLDKKAMLRLPPLRPTNTDISVKLKRLKDTSDVRRQKNVIIALRDINNPQALPYLALAFYRNDNPDLHELIEQAGKIMYWNINYSAMDANGRLKLEIARRRREGLFPLSSDDSQQAEPVPELAADDLANILNQAQKNRKRRKR